ncbi:MAG: hypothetical protein M5U28_42570 [Sandaracinaceae bacterium]|nr:hypothetical protein [Sandaracinaceae bacterium]
MSEADEEDDRDELRRALVDRPPVGWWASKLLRDRFELLERVGAGGMGEVWRAHDRETGATVAVKRLKRTTPRSVIASPARPTSSRASIIPPSCASWIAGWTRTARSSS